ncbi:hypothetical protein ACFU9B_43740 [Streptomyces sp. NPDC057592]|uniref:hypothetical protein n=1 Tax=unclassified Streptomyces TaxID=2593676 RepID=UPI00368F0871
MSSTGGGVGGTGKPTSIKTSEKVRNRLRVLADERGTTITQLLEELAGREVTQAEREQRAVEAARELGIEYTEQVQQAGQDTPLWPLCTARIPSSPAGTSKPPAVPAGVIVPSLSVLAAERQVTGAGRYAASLRFAENVPFTAGHAVDAMGWRAVDWPVAHAAAIAWHAVKAGIR